MADERNGFWENLGAKRFAPRKEATEPIPEKGYRRFFFILGTHFWKWISLNLLFLLFSIPIITIPAALCGLNRALMKLYREGNCFIWSEFIKEFRANIWKALPFGLIGAVVLFSSYYFLSLSISISPNHIDIVTAAIGLLLLFFAVLFLSYVFAFLPTLDLKNKQIARNAFVILITEWKTNLAILGSVVACALFTAVLFPYSLFFLLFFTISFQQYMICVAINTPMQARIIGPYEEQNK
jgi:uncharacterized membrane protein YesL